MLFSAGRLFSAELAPRWPPNLFMHFLSTQAFDAQFSKELLRIDVLKDTFAALLIRTQNRLFGKAPVLRKHELENLHKDYLKAVTSELRKIRRA